MTVNRKTGFNGLGVALLAGALALAAGTAAAQQKIRIGGVLALSGGGVASGISYRTGMEMAAKEINAAGGIGGKQIELVFGDDQSDATMAVGETKRLLFQEKISLMVGPLFSGQALATAPVFVEGNGVSINASGSSKINGTDTPNTFSMFLDVVTQTQAIVDYMAKIAKAKKVGILMDNGQQAREMIEQFKIMIPKAGMEIAGSQEYQASQADMTPELLSLRKTSPDIMFVNGTSGADFARIMKGRDDISWNVPVAASAVLSFLYREVVNTAGTKLLNGVSAQSFKALLYCANDPVGASPYAQFIKKIDPEALKRVSPINTASGYDAVYLYKAAVEGSGGKTDGKTIAKWIENNSSKVQKVTIGRYSASPTKHFLFGPDVLAMGEKFDQPRADGLFKQSGC